MYRVRHAVGVNTFELELLDGTLVVAHDGSPVRVSADFLIRLDMPEFDLGLSGMQTRTLELQDAEDHHRWHRATLERVLPDSTVVIRYDSTPTDSHIIDLTKERYRWIHDTGQ